jgi:DNA-binding NarL/FixJ family response regulator
VTGTTPAPDIRVLIVEDHPMVADGLARVLAAEDGVEVVATAANVAEGLRRALTARPDVAVLDQNLPDGEGTDLARRLREETPATAVVILSALAEEALVSEVVDAGCSGLVSKSRGAGDLVRAVRAAAAGETFLSADALRALTTRKATGPAVPGLTTREVEVLQCLADGLSNQAIGQRLYLSTNTVGNHLQRAMAKLGAHSKLEALVIGVRLGIVELRRPEGRAGVS